MLRRSLVTITACCLALAALGLGVGIGLRSLRPSSPFTEEAVDRSTPALLRSLTDLATLHAAKGEYQVLVDVEEDTRYVPAVVKGERTVYAAIGSVDAVVDLGALSPAAVTRAPDGSAVVTLPPVSLEAARLDLAQSRIVAKDRGILDRIGSAVGDDKAGDAALQILAEEKVAAAAAADVQLRERAEASAKATVERVLAALGVSGTVRFASAPG